MKRVSHKMIIILFGGDKPKGTGSYRAKQWIRLKNAAKMLLYDIIPRFVQILYLVDCADTWQNCN